MPFFYLLMTVLGFLIINKLKVIKSKFFTIMFGIFISVLVYYLNYFSSLFGSNADDSQQIVDITDVVIRDSSNNDFAATSISRSTYFNFTTKTTSGRPSQYYFERTINPTLFLYPAADTTYTLRYYALVRMFDSGDYTNNAQIPFRFLPCITAGLAYYIAMKKSPERIGPLKQIYEDEFQRAAAQDGERTSLFLTPKTYLPGA